MDKNRPIPDTAIDFLLEMHPELSKKRRGLPRTGSRKDGLPFFPDTHRIDSSFAYSNSLYSYEHLIDKSLKCFNAGAGSPLKTAPFPPSSKALAEIADSEELSQYPIAAGDIQCRESIARYLSEEGFRHETEEQGRISADNIIFVNSTTEGFSFVLSVITRPYDVVLFTGPTYGLFVYLPERLDAISKIIPLKEEDGWLPSPKVLNETIACTNKELESFGSKLGLPYAPRVAAYVNINPNNPTGKIMGIAEKPRLEAISEICSTWGVFIIDDIIYRDVCFDPQNVPVPLSTLDNPKRNIITLMGLSKSFGLAGVRAGMIIADRTVIRGVRDKVFQNMDSTPLTTAHIMRATFSHEPLVNEEYEAYFGELNRKYREKWKLLKFLVEGEGFDNPRDHDQIEQKIFHCLNDNYRDAMKPIPEIRIVESIVPEAGFFAILDFSYMKGRTYEGELIESDRDVLRFFYLHAYVKLLMGSSIGWPMRDKIIARVSFAFEDEDIIRMIAQMKNAIRLSHERRDDE